MKTASRINTIAKYVGGFVAVLGVILAVIAVFRGDSPNSALITYLLGFTCYLSALVTELQWDARDHRKATAAAFRIALFERGADRNARGDQ